MTTRSSQRNLQQILNIYNDYLMSRVAMVHILGDTDERELKEVFVELSLSEQRSFQPYGPVIAQGSAYSDSSMRQRGGPKRSLKPSELLKPRTKAVITGPPGCGKTTLLKYVALRKHQNGKHLVIWIELKAINKSLFSQAEKAAADQDNLILAELWFRHIKNQLLLSDGEVKTLRRHWQEKFRINEITVLLDGFDELQDSFVEQSLNKSIREFNSALHNNSILISTRPYAQRRLGGERLQEFEIQPLNIDQIEAFLDCYYPNLPATKSLVKTLRERSALRGLLSVPLLLGVILRLHIENKFTDKRLELYEALVVGLIHELDRSKSVTRQFKIKDERLRLDFLKFVAFEQLMHDQEEEANRIVFSYDVLKEKARAFLAYERVSYASRDLVDDVLSTTLLREVGADIFAFTHLTLQEYFAARAFCTFYKRNELHALRTFCRAYHNLMIVELEVLPMIMGALAESSKLYQVLEQLPESLEFASLCVRARGLTYGAKVRSNQKTAIIKSFSSFLTFPEVDDAPYLDLVLSSFYGVPEVEDVLLETLKSEHMYDRARGIRALRQICTERAINGLYEALKGKDRIVRQVAGRTLLSIGSERAIDCLLRGLKIEDNEVRSTVADLLSKVNNERVVDGLVETLNNSDPAVRLSSIKALHEINSKRAVAGLLIAANDINPDVSSWAVAALIKAGSDQISSKLLDALKQAVRPKDVTLNTWAVGTLFRVGTEQAVDGLLIALRHQNKVVRRLAVAALEKLRSTLAINGLLKALEDSDANVRWVAAEALGKIGSDRAVLGLLKALTDPHKRVRSTSAIALGMIGSDLAANALQQSMKDQFREVRLRAALAMIKVGFEPDLAIVIESLSSKSPHVRELATSVLGHIGSEAAIDELIKALKDSDDQVRSNAATVLGDIGCPRAVSQLLETLHDEDNYVRIWAAYALGNSGSAEAVAGLLEALSDKDASVCLWSAQALTKIPGNLVAKELEIALSNNRSFVRRKAVQLVGYYSDDATVMTKIRHLAEKDGDVNVRTAAKESMARFGYKLKLIGNLAAEHPAEPLADNESRELFLVGEVYKVVAEAGHIFRPTSNSDWGIDGEIEFKNEQGEASGRRVYLQLKSGDSHLRRRKRDGKEIFTIKNSRHAEFWQSHAYPVLLVICNSKRQTRWMNVTAYLQSHPLDTKHIEFQGELFTAESVKHISNRLAR